MEMIPIPGAELYYERPFLRTEAALAAEVPAAFMPAGTALAQDPRGRGDSGCGLCQLRRAEDWL
jgi:hypothetical protein